MQKKSLETTDGEYNGLTETFFLTFVGELVEILASFPHKNSELPISVIGYVLDADKEYYYLGDTPDEITQAVQRSKVVHIQIVEPFNPALAALENMDMPEEGKEN